MKVLSEVWDSVLAAIAQGQTSAAFDLVDTLITERDAEIRRLLQFKDAQDEALRSAGVHEDRLHVHISDLAEALGAMEAGGNNILDARAKLEVARETCKAFREFLDGFDARLAGMLSTLGAG